MEFTKGMCHNKHHQILDDSKRSPSFLAVFNSLQNGEVQRVKKYAARLLEAHAVLPSIGEVLGLVPLKPNASHPAIIITII